MNYPFHPIYWYDTSDSLLFANDLDERVVSGVLLYGYSGLCTSRWVEHLNGRTDQLRHAHIEYYAVWRIEYSDYDDVGIIGDVYEARRYAMIIDKGFVRIISSDVERHSSDVDIDNVLNERLFENELDPLDSRFSVENGNSTLSMRLF